MKNAVSVFVLLSLMIGCKSYIQVFEVTSEKCQKSNEFWIYENDTLSITYAFWYQKGILSFAVNNKTDKPLYIDWKKSSYIHNSNKLNYWVNEEISASATYYGTYYYPGPVLKPNDGLGVGSSASIEKKLKRERITFIPPNSNYYRSQFHLLPIPYYKFDLDTRQLTPGICKHGRRSRQTAIFTKTTKFQKQQLDFHKENCVFGRFLLSVSGFFIVSFSFFYFGFQSRFHPC